MHIYHNSTQRSSCHVRYMVMHNYYTCIIYKTHRDVDISWIGDISGRCMLVIFSSDAIKSKKDFSIQEGVLRVNFEKYRSWTVNRKAFKVPLRSNFSYSIFLHFRVEYDSLTHLPKFQPFTKIGSIFFPSFLFTILRPPLLGLVPEVQKKAWLKVAGIDVIDSTRDLHMVNLVTGRFAYESFR